MGVDPPQVNLPLKPADCTCSYPQVIVRNMVGHPPTCPVYQRWMKQHRQPQQIPVDASQEPAERAQPCKACEGRGTILRWLGQPEEPCEKCGGSGVIEVTEERLSPWQQRVEKMLGQILAYVEPGVARAEAEDRTLDSPEVQAKCEQILRDFIMKDRSE